MQFPESVLTKGRGDKLEVRTLESRGRFVICKYLDPNTMKLADNKRKLTLRDEAGNIQEFFIIPLKDAKRSLLIKPEKEEKDRKLWNLAAKREEGFWLD